MKSLGSPESHHDREVEIRVIARVIPYLWPKGQNWVNCELDEEEVRFEELLENFESATFDTEHELLM